VEKNTMKTRQHRTAILATAFTLLAAATAATATDTPTTCTTNGGANWRVTATGPLAAPCPPLVGGECSEIRYLVTPLKGKTADHVAVLADHSMEVVVGDSRNLFPECDGDNVTGIGIRDCSNQAVRMNKEADTGTFDLVVKGAAGLIGKSIVIKKGTTIEECRIASLGPTTCNPKAQQAAKETFTFDDCVVEIELDPCTGEPGVATVVSGDCAIDSGPIESLQIVINGTTQNVTVGDGWISSGENSCTTTLFGGKKYTTCSCRDASDCSVKNSAGAFICGTDCPR
jgi:hypothetical protein